MNRLGERIRRKREQFHLQLNDLAKKVGITSSALSQIENAKASPSLSTIKTIAECLNTTVGELIGEHEVLSRNPFIPYTDKRFVKENGSGAQLYLLSNHDPGKLMDTYLISFKPGANSEDIVTKHPGQEFIFVYSGAFEIDLEHTKYHVSRGDSFYFNAGKVPHIINKSSGISELLWIISPPNI
jgi:XRE family transcriptional regulator, regulator of sulfur utilization